MRHATTRILLLLCIAAAVPACGGGGGGGGGSSATTTLVSESLLGADGDGDSDQPSMSADGRYVAFRSAATNLMPAPDALAFTDIFRKDLQTGTVVRISRTGVGAEPNGNSSRPVISADGEYIAYVSAATDIVGTATGTYTNVYLYNHNGGGAPITTLVSNIFSSATTEATGNSDFPSIAVTAGPTIFVAFQSAAQNVLNGLTYGPGPDIYLKQVAGATTLISVSTTALTTGDGASNRPSLSSNGTLIAFESLATNLVAGDTNAIKDIFVRSVAATTRVSLSIANAQLTGALGEGCFQAAISGDGAHVAFATIGTDMNPADLSPNDIYIRANWATGAAATSEMSFNPATATTGQTCQSPILNSDGSIAIWHSATTNLVNADTNGQRDVFRRNRTSGTLDRVSLTSAGGEALLGGPVSLGIPAVSSNGAFVAFDSNATNMVTPAPSAFRHIYRRG